MPKPAKARAPNTTAEPSNTLNIESAPGADRAMLLAQTILRPSVQAAVTIQQWRTTADAVELGALVEALRGQGDLACSGNLGRAEATLMVQVHTLDAIFNNLARRAALNAGEYLSACETYMRLALKAQSQCRATIETLAEMKYPKPIAFVQQANIANGPQQVNNAPRPGASRAGNPEIPPNELLEQQHNESVVTGAAQTARSGNSSVEAVGAVDRAKDQRG
jgi:hypothetical protein